MPWDSMNGIAVNEKLLARYLSSGLRGECAEMLSILVDESLPRIGRLPFQVIHNDAHLGNLLADPDDAERLCGVIDFGDLIKRPVVLDMASALASLTEGDADLLGAAHALLDGFTEHFTPAAEQLDLLYDAVCARQILTVLLFRFRLAEVGHDPEIAGNQLPMAEAGLRHALALDRGQFRGAMHDFWARRRCRTQRPAPRGNDTDQTIESAHE